MDDFEYIPGVWNDGKPRVWTSSRLHKVWLTSVRGYTVRLTSNAPRHSRFGRIVYRRKWLLVKESDEN